MKSALLLDVVVCQRQRLFARKDEALLIGGDPFFVLYLAFDCIYRIGAFNLQVIVFPEVSQISA